MIGTQALNRSCGLRISGAVEERSKCGEVVAASHGGALRSDYPDMSNDKCGQNPHRRKDKVSRVKFVCPGLGGS